MFRFFGLHNLVILRVSLHIDKVLIVAFHAIVQIEHGGHKILSPRLHGPNGKAKGPLHILNGNVVQKDLFPAP